MGIFNVIPYPPLPALTCGKACLDIPKLDYIWVNLLTKNQAQFMIGDLDDFKKSGFKRNHSKPIVTLELKEQYQTFNNRGFNGEYKLYRKKDGGSLFVRLKIKFKKIQIPDINYDGLLISFADYRYYLGLLKRKK